MRHAACIVLSASALAMAACRPGAAARGGVPEDEIWVQPEQEEREVVEVREEEVAQAVAAAGRVAFDDRRVQHVLSPVAGRVTRVLARPGERVRRGSGLAALLSPEVGSALSDLARARADQAQAASELTRQERLVAVGAGPARDLEAAQDASRKAEAELARAAQKAALLRAHGVDAVTQELTLQSAIEGEVMMRAASPGMEVQGAYSGGAPAELFTIGDIDAVWVLADVAEEDLARVRVGAEAEIRAAAWPGRVFRGKVQWIASALDPALRTARVRVALENPDHALKPEMFAQVSIVAPARRRLVVPHQAVVTIEGEAFAYAGAGQGDDGRLRFRRRRVRVSAEPAGALVTVESGLSAGERVLVEEASLREVVPGEVRISRRQFEKAGLRLDPAREQDVGDELTASGRVAFDDQRVAHVFSPVTGRVVRVLAEPGQRVRKGAPLVAILSPEVGAAFADGVKAQADLVAAEHERARQGELFEAHAGARRDLEAAETGWRKARAELERARLKTRLLSAGTFDAVTQEYTLRSPIDGEVVARAAAAGLELQGQWAGAGSPVELFTIGALDPLWVMGDVYEMDLPHVQRGDPVAVRVPALPGRTFHGRVDWVSDVLDPATHTARVRCAIGNPGRALRPEMAPVLSVALPAHHHLAVPRSAVLRLGDETVVFVASPASPEGQLAFRRRKVIVGEDRSNGTVPVLEGLVQGEQVVTRGGVFLAGLL